MLRASDITDDDPAGAYTYTGLKVLSYEFTREVPELYLHIYSGLYRKAFVVNGLGGCAKERDYHIADEFIQRTAVAEYYIDHKGKVFVQVPYDLFGRKLFAGSGKAPDIGKEYRYILLYRL